MKKANILLRVGVLLLIATLATSGVFVGSTSAKYVASASLTASGRVALFKVVARASTTGSETFPSTWTEISQTGASKKDLGTAFNLGSVYELTSEISVSTTIEPQGTGTSTTAHIENNTGTMFAPGMGGSFGIQVRNDSEVAVRVWLDSANCSISGGSAGTGNLANIIQICATNSTTDGDWKALSNFADVLKTGNSGSNYVDLAPKSDTTYLAKNLWWRWKFERGGTTWGNASDVADTDLGVNGAQKLTLILTIQAQQIN